MQGKLILSNMLWRLAERSGSQAISFIVSVILARLLMPEEFGVISLITVLTSVLTLFIDGGFSNALIQKQSTDQTDYSTVFYFNLILGIGFYVGMFIAAPAIANFYQRSDMIPYIRVLSLTLIIGGFNGVQQALVAKRMQYKRFFYSSLGGTLLSAVVGVAMAFTGFGVWSLIAQRLTDQLVDSVILWFTVQWRPSFCFSITRLKPLACYGGKLIGSSLLYSLTNNLTSLLIGKFFSTSELAYYEKGRQVPMWLVYNLQAVAQSVLFSAMAEQQSEKDRIRAMLRKSVIISAYSIFPCVTGIAVCAEPLVRILFTEKWIELVPYLQIWCFISATYLLDTANLQVIQALGRSDIYLKIEIVKEIITVISLLIAIPFGVLTILIVSCIERPLFWYINADPCRKLVEYGFVEQLMDLKEIIGLNLFLGMIVWSLGHLPINDIALLVIQVLSGIGIYVVGSVILKIEAFGTILKLLKTIIV